MRFASFIIAILVLSACHRHALPQATNRVETRDSVTVTYLYHDTVVTAASDSVVIHDTIPCPQLDYSSQARDGRQQVSIRAHGGILDVKCSSDSLRQVIQLLGEKLCEVHWVEKDSTIIRTVKVPVTRYPALLWYSLGLNILLLIILYFSFSSGGPGGWLPSIFTLIKK